MSFELDYFPPKGTVYRWTPKALNYSPWFCDLGGIKGLVWPASVFLRVDLVDGDYKWMVEVCNWRSERTLAYGFERSPLEACLEAERRGVEAVVDLTPAWVRTALENGWRPPAS